MVPRLHCSMTHPISRRSLRPHRPQLSRAKLVLPGSLLSLRTGVSHQWPPSSIANRDSHPPHSSQYAGPCGPHLLGPKASEAACQPEFNPCLASSCPSLNLLGGRGGEVAMFCRFCPLHFHHHFSLPEVILNIAGILVAPQPCLLYFKWL